MSEEIKNFTLSFFTSLGANLNWVGDILEISNISEGFERFYGKKGPYKVRFEQAGAIGDVELLTKGSFLLNCMKDYLNNRGETTLLKIDFDFDPKQEISKNFILRNCNIDSLNKKADNQFILRFTFLTNFQYMNEKEQFINQIYIENNDIIDFDIDKYKTSEGKKEDIKIESLRQQYSLAKDRVKKLIEPKIQEIGSSLDLRLAKEIERVKQHYANQTLELDEIVNKNNKQIEELKKQAERAKTEELKQNVILKIKKIEELNNESLDPIKREALKKEEAFFINDETYKHSLNIDTKLINTSIIYYPIFTFSGFIKSLEGNRLLEIKYNPLTKEFSKLFCDCCKKELGEINLCSGGHITCRFCLRGCSNCGKDYCNNCLTKTCFSCGKRLCRKCAIRCVKCNKYKCESHMNSLRVCSSCS